MKKVVLLLLLLSFCTPVACAYEESYAQQQEIIGSQNLTRYLPAESRRLLGQEDASQVQDLGEAVGEMLQKTEDTGTFAVRQAISMLCRILVVIVLCGFVRGYSGENSSLVQILSVVGALSIIWIVFEDFQSLMTTCLNAIEDLDVFSKGMLPVMTAAIAISGAPTAAAIVNSITMYFFDLLIHFINIFFVPSVCAYLAVVTTNAAIGNDLLGKLGAFIKWFISGALKLILTIFIGYISVSGVVSGSVDSAAVKTAKFAVSGAVPVVGGIISDATESMLSGAILLKNTTGVFGMLCIVAICLIPFIQLGISYLILKGGTAVLSPLCDKNLSSLLSGISDSFSLLLGMLGTCSLILFLELVFSVTLVS